MHNLLWKYSMVKSPAAEAMAYQHIDAAIDMEQFVLNHVAIVKKISYHIKCRLPCYIDIDDIIQAGIVGLLEAQKNFKDHMGASFETFAGIRIRGAILDFLRKHSATTQQLSKNMRKIRAATQILEREKSRSATAEEISEYLQISVEEYMRATRKMINFKQVSLHEIDDTSAFFADDSFNPLHLVQEEKLKEKLILALTGLPERQQIILSLYYMEELNFKQVGEILNVTEARVCQLHKEALSCIKSQFKDVAHGK